jgi:hypothetical protein
VKRGELLTAMTGADSMERFWLVWNPQGRNPNYRHARKAGAEAESKRLATQYPGTRFYVLSALSFAQTREPVEVTELVEPPDDDDLPF